ncbi:glycosyltransferase family 4 protein [Sunxiuqinia sp. sy24]|uniref:glycosyltransferase family 4 protein n=1 Tax=Sunxiuqinia sp. sy24 TaxID=3461495 RepID=UPI0040459211
MIIAVNTRLLQKNKLEGIGWFTRETLARITRKHPEHQFLFLFDRPYSDEFIFSENVTPLVISPPTRHPVLWWLWFEYRIPRVLKKYKADLFVSPDGYLSLRTPVKQLAVIHDLNFVHRPQDLPWLMARYFNYFFPKFARRANRLATVSKYSKEDIQRTYGMDSDTIDVVYNGVNLHYTPTSEKEKQKTRQRFTAGQPYFLYVGSLHPRKNLASLLLAYEAFRNSGNPNVKLLIAGEVMFKTREITQVYGTMSFQEDIIFTGRLSVEDLHQVLGAALALTFVPYFEGFGLPVLEAMRAGIPVICSNTSSLPEVGGDAVLYVDPSQPRQLAEAMSQLAGDLNLWEELVVKGQEQQAKFSWDKTADSLWQSIQNSLKD